MGLFDWLKAKPGQAHALPERSVAPPPAPNAAPEATDTSAREGAAKRRFSTDRADLFDIGRTTALHGLFQVPRQARDEAWNALFYDAAWHGSTELPSPQPFVGPDFFPYLRFDVPRGGAFESQSLGNLAPELVRNAVGAAFFASPDDPSDAAQFVFSMGRLHAMLRFDSAEGDPTDLAELEREIDPAVYDVEQDEAHQRLTVKQSHEVLVGHPSRDVLPPEIARPLYRHLRDGWKIAEPRVALMVDPATTPSRSLIIGRRFEEFPDGQDVDRVTQMLLWYFPPRQMLMLQPGTMALDEMAPLANYLDEGGGD